MLPDECFRCGTEALNANALSIAGTGAASPAEMPVLSGGLADSRDRSEFFGDGRYVGAVRIGGGMGCGCGARGVEAGSGARLANVIVRGYGSVAPDAFFCVAAKNRSLGDFVPS